MASYEIVFPDQDGGMYSVREMEYCQDFSRCPIIPPSLREWAKKLGAGHGSWEGGRTAYWSLTPQIMSRGEAEKIASRFRDEARALGYRVVGTPGCGL